MTIPSVPWKFAPNCKQTLLLVAVLLTMLPLAFAQHEDSCADILSIGLRDNFKHISSGTLSDQIRQYSLDTAYDKESQNFGLNNSGVAFTPDGVFQNGTKIDFSKNGDQGQSHEGRFEQDYYRTWDEYLAYTILDPIAKDAIAAWRECIGGSKVASQLGVHAKIEHYDPDAQRFDLEIHWQGIDQQLAPRIKEASFPGVTCSPNFPASPLWGTYDCKRHKAFERVKLTLVTKDGTRFSPLTLPKSDYCPIQNCDRCANQKGQTTCMACSFRVRDQPGASGEMLAITTDRPSNEGPRPDSFPSGFNVHCSSLPKGQLKVVAHGSVGPNFRVNGHSVGDVNSNLHWQYVLDLDVDLGDGPGPHGDGFIWGAQTLKRGEAQ